MRIVWPMGCKRIKTDKELQMVLSDDNYIGQEKIKGIRAVMHVLPDGSLRFTTRGATLDNPDEPIDITHRLPHLNRYKLKGLEGSEFDCEMWDPELDDAEIAGKLNYKSTVHVPDTIHPYCFDITLYREKDLMGSSLRNRLKLLSHLKCILSQVKWLHFLPYVTGRINKSERLQELLEAGKEGMVFKNLNSLYFPDKKKAGCWYKYKKEDTLDAVITGCVLPEQYYCIPNTNQVDLSRETKPWKMGWIGSLTFRFEVDGVCYMGACAGMTDQMKEFFSDGNHNVKEEFIGRTIEVEFFEKNKLGNLEHPRFIRLREEIEKNGTH